MIGYTEHINLVALVLGAGGLVLVVLAARIGVRAVPIYVMMGVAIWFAFHESGIHATLAGVILGLLTPARSWVSSGNAGVVFSVDAVVMPVPVEVMVGLVIGKPAGIMIFSWLAIRRATV